MLIAMTRATTTRRIHRSSSIKAAALTALKLGATPRKVSKDLNLPERTIYNWRDNAKAAGTWEGGDNNNVAKAAPRKSDPGSGGQNKMVDKKLLKKIQRKLAMNPFVTADGLKRAIPGLAHVSVRTIQRAILKDLELPSRKAAKKPFLSELHKSRRLDWAKRHQKWSRVQWSKVLWSDETHIELWNSNHMGHNVQRPSDVSRYHPSFVRCTVKFPPKLMIWGSFGNSRLGSLYFVAQNEKMNAEMYISVLRNHLKRSMKKTGCKIFMQDGAPCHKAHRVMNWLDDHDVDVLEWVGQSCDANPIENLWTFLKRIIASMGPSKNLEELQIKINKAWKVLSREKEILRRLTYSMTDRCDAIIAAAGDCTKY